MSKSKQFIAATTKMLLELGAARESEEREFTLYTQGGGFWIRIDENVKHSYWLYGKFRDIEKAKEVFPNLPFNKWSGKHNQYEIGNGVPVEEAVESFKERLKILL